MKKITFTLLIQMAVSGVCFSQNLVGNLSGVIGPGTYHLTGNATVQQHDSLVILPGTTILADGVFAIGVFGYFSAVGTETDSIIFTHSSPYGWWNGLDFSPATRPASRMEYCSVSRSETHGIQLFGCSPPISHCTIYDNSDDSNC